MHTYFVKIDFSFDLGDHTIVEPAGYLYVNATSEAEAWRRAEGMLAAGQAVAGVTYLDRSN